MFWDEKNECMSLEEMRKVQLKTLQDTVRWVSDKIPFYKNRFDDIGLEPGDINSLEDLAKLPFTVKTDLRDNYPFGLCAVPMNEVVRIHASSGTTGKPITGPYTKEDIDQWAECMARNLFAAGVRSNDICQNAYGMGLFTGGLGFHQGANKIGAAVIPASSGQTERQIILMQDFRSTVLFCTPSYALTIAERAEEMGVDMKTLPLHVGVFGAEPWTVEMRKEIEEKLGIKAMEAYGLTELVFTSLQRRAMPIIRYRTRDMTTLRREKCECGRTFIKMDKVYGRSDDMLIISGVNVFPSQIESLLLEVDGIEPQYVIIVRKKGYLDSLSIDVEAKKEIYEAGKEKMEEIQKIVEEKIRGMIGIGAKIRLVPPKTIARSEGKAKRVFDERKM